VKGITGFTLFVSSAAVMLSAPVWAQQNGSTPQLVGLSVMTQRTNETIVPRLTRYSGTVFDSAGKVVTGEVGLMFSLYELQTGGSPLWVEVQAVQLDAQGRYNVLLGASSPDGLPLDLFTSGKALWLGVQPQLPGAAEMPRVLLVAVPYALKAADADTLGGKPASAFVIAGTAAPDNSNPSRGGEALNQALSPNVPNMMQTIMRKPGIGGSGAPNSIPIWTDNTMLGNSIMFQTINKTVTAINSLGDAANFASTKEGSNGLEATGGGGNSPKSGGTGLIATGGDEMGLTQGNGGTGLVANGGQSFVGAGGAGVRASGGASQGGVFGGNGVVATGGFSSFLGEAGAGVEATGGMDGGSGIIATGGNGFLGIGVVAVGGSNFAGDGIEAIVGGGAVYPSATAPFAGVFTGDVTISGTLTSGVKDFLIDHPLDPANKYLCHASVESSEMMNIYTGNIILDSNGQAMVQLPAWFQAENADFRYQLTAIGMPAPGLYIAQEIQDNNFRIAGGQPGLKVSWQVSGVRQDAYAKAHPLVVEVEKPAKERGYFIHPELHGAPAEKSVEWARHPVLMKRIKERQQTAAKLPRQVNRR
jgi:hypothetical protein